MTVVRETSAIKMSQGGSTLLLQAATRAAEGEGESYFTHRKHIQV